MTEKSKVHANAFAIFYAMETLVFLLDGRPAILRNMHREVRLVRHMRHKTPFAGIGSSRIFNALTRLPDGHGACTQADRGLRQKS